MKKLVISIMLLTLSMMTRVDFSTTIHPIPLDYIDVYLDDQHIASRIAMLTYQGQSYIALNDVIQSHLQINLTFTDGQYHLQRVYAYNPVSTPPPQLTLQHLPARRITINDTFMGFALGPTYFIPINTLLTPHITASYDRQAAVYFKSILLFPKRYSTFDELPLDAYIRHQGVASTCWAYAASTMSELYIGKVFQAYEQFSPEHIIEYSPIPATPTSGGHFKMSFAYYASRLGPFSLITDDIPYHIDGYAVYMNDIDRMKNHILRYGAVISAIHFNIALDMLYHENTASYYNPNPLNVATHEVVIIGWDDTYPKENFKIPPKQNGAFIVQNSFGANWGENGLFYVSYEDTTIASLVYGITEVSINQNQTLVRTHAPTGYTHFDALDFSLPATGFSVFKSDQPVDKDLYAIGIYILSDHSKVTLFAGLEPFSTQNPREPIGVFYNLHAGYHVLPLSPQLTIKKDSTFFIGATIQAISQQGIPIEAPFPMMDYDVEGHLGEGFIGNESTFMDVTLWRNQASIALNAYLK